MDRQAIERKLQACGLKLLRLDESANPAIEPNHVPLTWQDLHHPRLAQMVEDYRLDEVTGHARNEFEQLLHLRHWVHRTVPRGAPEWNPDQPWLLADLARSGRAFYCSHYADVLMYAATALGWPARHVGIDRDHAEGEQSTHHGVTEVFCYEPDKWVVLDAMFDVHFEHRGTPLSAMEVRNTFLHKGPKAIARVAGLRRRRTPSQPGIEAGTFDQAAGYFWFNIPTRNNHFSQPTWQGNERLLLFTDEANRAKTWYQNQHDQQRKFVKSRLHTGYRADRFLKTEQVADVYPPLGRTHIDVDLSLPRGKTDPALPVVLHTINPHWGGFEVRFDAADPWTPVARRVDWRLHPGRNTIEARLITLSGRTGRPAQVEIVLKKKATEKKTAGARPRRGRAHGPQAANP